MKKTLVFLALLFLAATGARAQLQTCTITATVYDWQGQPADSVEVRVVKVLNQAGKLIVARPYSYQTDTNGQAAIVVPRSTATDTVTAYIFIDVWNSAFAARGRLGVGVAVPNAATANLEDLAPDDAIPLTHVVAVPTIQFRDSTGARTVTSDTIHIGAGLLLVNSPAGSNDYTLISTAGAAIDTTGYFARYGGVMTESDPVALPIATAAQDSSRLANQRADVLEDTTAQHRIQIDTKQNVLTAAQVARLDSSLAAGYKITITSQGTIAIVAVDTSGFFAAYGGVMTESDPTATAKAQVVVKDTIDAKVTRGATLLLTSIPSVIDTALTSQARSMSSNGRIVSLQDSVTLTVAPNETIDLSTGNNFRLTLTANDTLGFAGGIDGQVIQVVVTNAGTHTLTWTGVAWPGGTAPTLTAVANKRSIFSFLVSGGMIHGVSVLNY